MTRGLEGIEELLNKLIPKKICDANSLMNSGFLFTISKNKDIEKEIENIFFKVRSLFPSYLPNLVLYLLGELIDNINQHSQYSKGFILLDYNKSSRKTHIIIFDNGISIPKTFQNNKIQFEDDTQAIKMAIKGKSTKKEEGRGYGLSSSANIIEKGLKGKISIISRKGIYSSDVGALRELGEIEGTFIYISFDKGEDLNIYKYLD